MRFWRYLSKTAGPEDNIEDDELAKTLATEILAYDDARNCPGDGLRNPD
jgi:hypothetical protein